MDVKEQVVQHKLKRKLDAMGLKYPVYYFVKEAGSIRGIPDIVGHVNGKFFALEVKKNESEANAKTGRIVLQRYTLDTIKKKGGFASFVYPENMDYIMKELEGLCLQ